MQVAGNQGVAFREARWKLVPIHGQHLSLSPAFNHPHWKVRELPGESAIMVAAHGDQFRTLAQFSQSLLDPLTLRRARARRMHHIAQKNDTPRSQFSARPEHLLASPRIRQRPQFSAPPLRPAIAQMQIRHNQGLRNGQQQRSGSMRQHSGQN
jgi:hypothetical protein